MKILILGGAGAQAYFAIEKLIDYDFFDEMVLADYDKEKVEKTVRELNNPKLKAVGVDVLDKESLVALMNDADVVANCTGPYYKLLEPTLDALMESTCKNYIDFCDDIDAFEAVITPEKQKEAEDRGMRIIVGLGGSPGLLPIECMYGASLMDETHTVKLNMLFDELEEGGPAVWDHMFENYNGTIEVFKDGKLQTEKGLEVVKEYEFDEKVFGDIGKVNVYTLGHPEVYTLPKALPDLKDIEINCTFYPVPAMDMVIDLNRLGMLNTKPVKVGDVEVSPRAVLLEMMNNTVLNPDYPGGFDPNFREEDEYGTGTAIEVHGKKDGKDVIYKSSFSAGMGPLTGYPLAIGAVMLGKGEIDPVGIMIPEHAITKPGDFVEEAFNSIKDAGHKLKRHTEVTYDLN